MIRQPISSRWRIVLGIAAVVVLLAGYTWLSHRQKQSNPDDTTVPSWSQLGDGVKRAAEAHRRTGERWLLVDAKATGARLLAGMLCGVGGAIIVGLLMGCFPVVESVLAPPLTLFAKVPGTAAMAVFFVLVGTGFSMFVAMIAFGVLPALALSVLAFILEKTYLRTIP